jgi:amino acid transporter
MSNITIVVQYLFTCLAVPAIRARQGPAPAKAFVIPGGPLIPIIGALGSLTFLAGPIGGLLRLESESILEVVFAMGTLVLGILVAALFARRQKGAGGAAGP